LDDFGAGAVNAFSTPRFARVGDAMAVRDVLRDARAEIPIGEDLDTDAYLKGIRADCKSRLFWVVDCDEDVSGVMKLIGGDIFYLAVKSTHRHKGIARALVRCAKKRNGALTGKTRDDNAATIALLYDEGFRRDTVLTAREGWHAYSWARSDYMRRKHRLG
jgi:ribosomal protein S18 acetylase RimI-like enzyme